MTTHFTARPATTDGYHLGEGPLWDPGRQRLLWVDITAGAVHEGRLDTATGEIAHTRARTFDSTVGAVAVAADGGLLVAERHTLVHVDDRTGTRTPLARLLPADRHSRLNDGAVDPAGRFLVGSLAQDDRTGEELLLRQDGTVLDDDLRLSNGLAWSPDGSRLYSIDTLPGTVWTRDYDPATGATGPRRRAFTLHHPDGMCADADGNLWIALWGGGRVERRTPDGDLLAVVTVDAPHTSSVTFAGPGLNTLVITTARQDLSPADLARHPHSGRLFTARVDAVGLPTTYWNPAL
ncbi:SMP-30/gluconolactonase/LRE family protein [Actinoplanes sp. NPDC049802]|uniref:SMP-30/gluconolactonase/LRE family protein n=1 Tax=Actinoplanes sp. NPDC049802 TaxID=3154742 RepID=UPI0033FD1BC5